MNNLMVILTLSIFGGNSAFAETIPREECRVVLSKDGHGQLTNGEDYATIQGSEIFGTEALARTAELIAIPASRLENQATVGGVRFEKAVTLRTTLVSIGESNTCEGMYSANEVQICTFNLPYCVSVCQVRWAGRDCR